MSRDQKPGKARVFASATTPGRRADDPVPEAVEPSPQAPAPVSGPGLATALLFLLSCASGGAGLAAARAWGIA